MYVHTFKPSCPALMAATYPATPPPIMTKSFSSAHCQLLFSPILPACLSACLPLHRTDHFLSHILSVVIFSSAAKMCFLEAILVVSSRKESELMTAEQRALAHAVSLPCTWLRRAMRGCREGGYGVVVEGVVVERRVQLKVFVRTNNPSE